MAPRGVGAFVVIASLILSMTLLSGIGYYASLGAELDADSHNQDVQDAADELNSVGFGEDRSSSVLEGPLAVVTPVVGIFQTLSTVVTNTSGVLQLLYGIPAVAADLVETVFRFAMVVSLLYLIRSGAPV
jgi:hypothetical protein